MGSWDFDALVEGGILATWMNGELRCRPSKNTDYYQN